MCASFFFARGHVLTRRLDLFVLAASSGRYTLTVKVDRSRTFLAAYVVCYYDWIISLDEEVAFIYSAPWNVVKAAYLFCRYYPLAVAPFHFWGFVGDHEQRVCESYYHALSACTIPTCPTYYSIRSNAPAVFSITDPPTVAVVKTAGEAPGFSRVQAPFAYHLGILTASFDGLNLFVVVWHCIRGARYPRPPGTEFSETRQVVICPMHLWCGILAYVIMTVLNMLTIGTFFSTRLLHQAKGIGPWLLMLRRKASPTDTDLRIQYSHMVNEALEMVAVEWHPEEVSEGFTPSISTEAQAQP
ncbi:hypothetical protein BJY52DRAFT_1227223 [Lactarius psammicola]|nr:hypothetical protein BJY52DRAFT_1227223 [Lactarius psammicola]